ncbi:MAG: helix-turn-helix domain-containing protein [Candidatus Accumulibacter sp.]|jgi:transposase-like protein|nr:helix-turn-helix domain-containing protein [Accumulibacter sp.]
MKQKEFGALLAQVETLTAKQKTRLRQALDTSLAKPTPGQVIDEEFSAQRACPACGSQSVQKWGIVSGLQRYRCKECKRTFNALTGTSMAHLRKKELWEQYSQALSESLSLSKAAQRCGIDRSTAFRWRHRFLPRSGEQQVKCSGITEIDET